MKLPPWLMYLVVISIALSLVPIATSFRIWITNPGTAPSRGTLSLPTAARCGLRFRGQWLVAPSRRIRLWPPAG